MFRTHLAFGFLISVLALKFLEINANHLAFAVVVLFASILPDIDLSKSKVGKKSKPLSNFLGFVFGHRGLIHSIWLPILVFLFFYESIFAFAFLIGYLAHLILDGFTKEGLALFQPIFKIKLEGFIKTNSFFEKIFFILILFLSIYVLVGF